MTSYQKILLDKTNSRINKLISLTTNDLTFFTEKYQIVKHFHESETLESTLAKTLEDYLENQSSYNLHKMQHIYRRYKPEDIVAWIDLQLSLKINSIVETVKDHMETDSDEKLSIDAYLQIWSEFENFCEVLNKLFSKCFTYLNNKLSVMSIIQQANFHSKIIYGESNILSKVCLKTELYDYNKLSKFVESIKMILLLENHVLGVDKIFLLNLIKSTINNIRIVDYLCKAQHQIMLDLPKESAIKECQKILTLLGMYADTKRTGILYTKYLQQRLVQYTSDYNFEIQLLASMRNIIEPTLYRKATSIIYDASESKCLHDKLSNVRIRNVSGRKSYDVDLSVLYPTIMSRYKWMIPEQVDLDLKYPPEFAYVLNIIEKTFATTNTKEYIKWLPIMGSVTFSVSYDSESEVLLKCNMLQAIVLSMFNEKPRYNLGDLVSKLNIDKEICLKILASIVDAKVLNFYENPNNRGEYSLPMNNSLHCYEYSLPMNNSVNYYEYSINYNANLVGIIDVKSYFDAIIFGLETPINHQTDVISV
jgi:hypothetical protein